MPGGVRIFLGYAFLILGLIGLSPALGRRPGDQRADLARSASSSMVLLAYTIFTTTLVLQRKEASRGLALGLSTLTLPADPARCSSPAQPVAALIAALLAGAPVLRPDPPRGPHLARASPERACGAGRRARAR